MSKLLSILVAAVFAFSTGSVLAASHMKAAGGDKKEEMAKPAADAAKPAADKKADKKAAKADKKEAKADKKEMKKEEPKK